jgi:hypothetical protein
MTTPGVYSNPAQEAEDLDTKSKEAFEQGHDADLPINTSTRGSDVEKDAEGQVSKVSTVEADPNDVFWDGPDDPQNPLNWTAGRKWGNVAILSLVTLIT